MWSQQGRDASSVSSSPRAAALVPFLALTSGLVQVGCTGPELYVENDAFGFGRQSDRNYTNGVRFQNTITRNDAPKLVRDAAGLLRPMADKEPTEIGFVLGHSIYTPNDLEQSELIEDDRPYAAWAYGGLARIDTDFERDSRASDDQTTVELLLGVIGPPAQGEELQREAHELIGSTIPQGWDNQLETEPTVMLSIERQVRSWRTSLGFLDIDLLNRGSVSLGTPFTDAEIGTTLRFGANLPRDFGVTIAESGLTNSAVTRMTRRPRSFYFFAGAVGRGVAWNSFLDGNVFRDSHSVDRNPFVADFMVGMAMQLQRFRISYALVLRTPEFDEREDDHIFGSISIGFTGRE